MATGTTLNLAPRPDVEQLEARYRERGRVQIRDFLDRSSAEAIHRCLAAFSQWNLVYTVNGRHQAASEAAIRRWPAAKRRRLERAIYGAAVDQFQYFYASVPIYEIYHQELLPGHLLNSVFQLLNSEPLIERVRTITGDPSIGFADAQATRYDRGHFLTCHDDEVAGKDRRAAYVLNLTPLWRVEWGGGLEFVDPQGNVDASLAPAFNVLNLFRVPTSHFVGVVAPFAGASRLSVTGWFRAGVDPGL